MTTRTACLLTLCCGHFSAAEEQWAVTSRSQSTLLETWRAERVNVAVALLVLVPGYNGCGERMFDTRWKVFAEKNGFVLLAPTFKAEGMENNHGKDYYPEQGSGKILEDGIAEAGRRYGVQTEKVLFFGFSAGAHVSHRFALWKPDRVEAYVAVSAAWWSEPTEKMRDVPALIMCGEDDPEVRAQPRIFQERPGAGLPVGVEVVRRDGARTYGSGEGDGGGVPGAPCKEAGRREVPDDR